MKYTIVACAFYFQWLRSIIFATQTIPGLFHDRMLNIAHRGSSGILPDESCEAFQLAIDEGADVIECDVSITSDYELVCLHESWLNSTTNVAELFPSKKTTRFVQDQSKNITDWFSLDFTLAELHNVIRLRQPRRDRDQRFNFKFGVCTFTEFISIALASTRLVGIYPELKDPLFVNAFLQRNLQNQTFEQLLAKELNAAGFNSALSPAFVQCFNYDSLKEFQRFSPLPVVYLINDAKLVSNDKFLLYHNDKIYAVGVHKELIVPLLANESLDHHTTLIQKAHRYGLKVHAWTFANDVLHWDYGKDPYKEFYQFYQLGVDGIFTDFPASLKNYLVHEEMLLHYHPSIEPSFGYIPKSFM